MSLYQSGAHHNSRKKQLRVRVRKAETIERMDEKTLQRRQSNKYAHLWVERRGAFPGGVVQGDREVDVVLADGRNLDNVHDPIRRIDDRQELLVGRDCQVTLSERNSRIREERIDEESSEARKGFEDFQSVEDSNVGE
jgi:hypothetical protein